MRAPRERELIGAALAVAAAACFLALARPTPAQPAGTVSLEVVFGDPFALEWSELPLIDPNLVAAEPLPMVSSDGRCIGFTRTDWPEQDTHPSVARCFVPPRAGVVGVRKIAAGPQTWHIFVFDSPVRDVEVIVDDTSSPTHHAGSIAASALPTGTDTVVIEWTDDTARRLRAELGPDDA